MLPSSHCSLTPLKGLLKGLPLFVKTYLYSSSMAVVQVYG